MLWTIRNNNAWNGFCIIEYEEKKTLLRGDIILCIRKTRKFKNSVKNDILLSGTGARIERKMIKT